MLASWCRVLSCSATAVLMIGAVTAFADQPFTASPLGPQKVLVIPVEFPVGNACPNTNETCPAGLQAFYTANVGPPRHSPAQWEAMLNSITQTWWQQTTYGQTSFEFTVLSDPQTQDGWWPPPHSIQDYSRNSGNWYQTTSNNPPSYALVPDVTASVVQSICGNPLLFFVCEILPQYNRLVILQNVHAFGDQSLGNDYPFTIPTGTSLGNLVVSASWANEDSSDNGITSLMHELGHQSGELSHYGDCSAYFSFTSFNPVNLPAPGSGVECITGWDIMGLSYSFSQFSGYSKVSRGWINATSTPSFDLISGGKFSQNFELNPLEIAPTSSNPDVIRLSIGDLSWPTFGGYFVECREPVGGDVPSPFPSIPVGTIPDQGVLITNVHEYSLTDIPSAPAHHVERTLLPSDTLGTATLKPGQTFSDPLLGLSVRFNGYSGGDAGVQRCSVSIALLEALPPPPPQRIIRFAGNIVLSTLAQALDTGSLSSDIGVNQLIAPSPRVQQPIPLAAPWIGHNNPVSIRVHNRSTGPIEGVEVAVAVQQPAIINDRCTSTQIERTLGTSKIDHIGAASSSIADFNWMTARDSSVSLDVVAKGPANQIHTSSRFAFEFFNPGRSGQDIRSEFKIVADRSCMSPETYVVGPALLVPGWDVKVFTPTVTLNPGEETNITVVVTPPRGAKPGDHAEIPIVVRKPMQMLMDKSMIAPNTPANLTPGVHFMAVGAFTVLARTTAGPGSVTLECDGREIERSNGRETKRCINGDDLFVAGKVEPASGNSLVNVEYRSPQGKATTHFVHTNADGHYRDSIDVHERGEWVVQSRWSGGEKNDPTESKPLTIHFGRD